MAEESELQISHCNIADQVGVWIHLGLKGEQCLQLLGCLCPPLFLHTAAGLSHSDPQVVVPSPGDDCFLRHQPLLLCVLSA